MSLEVTLNGNPVWKVVMPVSSHPPIARSVARLTSAGDLLAATEGQVVDIAGDEPLVDVEVGRSVVQVGVVIVHEALVAGSAGADSGCRGLVVLALGPGIDRGCSQVVGAMLELDVHRVVVGSSRGSRCRCRTR